MGDDKQEKLDDLATDLDDLKIAVEEIKDERPDHAEKTALDTILTALEEASDTTDELGERLPK